MVRKRSDADHNAAASTHQGPTDGSPDDVYTVVPDVVPAVSQRGWLDESVPFSVPQALQTTPHSLRRTYISIALLANGFDVKWVMSQVGHADSKMTLDVYAQLEQRVKHEHGVRFDALVRSAQTQLKGADMDSDWETSGRRDANSASMSVPDGALEDKETPP
jgi:hypothetical protein